MNLCNVSLRHTKKMTDQVDVQIDCDGAWTPETADIRSWSCRTILATDKTGAADITIRVVDAKEMQALNRDYRQQDKPTNVLSFPAGAIAGLPDQESPPLGDIVVCAAIVGAEAESQGKAIADHWAHMIVHGTLHLLGFDHETETDAAAMENLEKEILGAHGVADPYGESPPET